MNRRRFKHRFYFSLFYIIIIHGFNCTFGYLSAWELCPCWKASERARGCRRDSVRRGAHHADLADIEMLDSFEMKIKLVGLSRRWTVRSVPLSRRFDKPIVINGNAIFECVERYDSYAAFPITSRQHLPDREFYQTHTRTLSTRSVRLVFIVMI